MTVIYRLLLTLLIGATFVGCDPANKAWKAAESENTIESFQQYVAEFPDSKFTGEAEQRIEALAWQNAESLKSEDAYATYAEGFPSGAHIEQAGQRLRELRFDGLMSDFDRHLLAFMRDEPSAITALQDKSWKQLDPRVALKSGGFDLLGGRTVIREGSVIVFVDREDRFQISCGIEDAQYAHAATPDTVESATFAAGASLQLQSGERLEYEEESWRYAD